MFAFLKCGYDFPSYCSLFIYAGLVDFDKICKIFSQYFFLKILFLFSHLSSEVSNDKYVTLLCNVPHFIETLMIIHLFISDFCALVWIISVDLTLSLLTLSCGQSSVNPIH